MGLDYSRNLTIHCNGLAMNKTIVMLRIFFFFFALIVSMGSTAQPSRSISISTKSISLVFGVDEKGKLKQVYFGKLIDQPVSTSLARQAPDAYPSYGTTLNGIALRMTHADGNLTTNLVYKSDASLSVNDNSRLTSITLKDSYYPVEVTLFYKTYIKEDIIEQWMELKHTEKEAVIVNEFASASFAFTQQSFFLNHFTGNWANEFNMIESPLQEGTKIVDSRLGVRTNQMTNPSFLVSFNQPLKENDGEVFGATLAWPGNFQFLFDLDHYGKLSLTAGMNPYASEYKLAPNTVFATPALLYTYSDKGAGAVSRRFHRWARQFGIADGDQSRDVLLNNWEATYFDFDEPKLTHIIREAGQMGFELFLLDDGWFANKYPRNNDDAGLGDWEVNKKKLPHGIGYLAEQCRQNNLKFGIWVEPEMVNPKSELYEKHPDWVITAANREPDPQRNQLILDITNPAVQEYVYSVLDKLVSENKGISYLKWDCNRYVTNVGSKYLGKDKQTHLFIDYPRAILQVMAKFRKKFPHITMMVCSGGSGRIDYASMRYFQEYWPSDNTDALDRIRIQWGLQYFFPAIGMASHVSVTPNHITGRATPLKFRFDVAMSGKLGMDLQPMQMSAEEKEFSKKALQVYKEIRPIVLHGDYYRLHSPYETDHAVIGYVSEDQKKALVFSYLVKKKIYGEKVIVRVQGLKAGAKYKISEVNKGGFSRLDPYAGKVFAKEELETTGIEMTMYNEFESNVILLEEQ